MQLKVYLYILKITWGSGASKAHVRIRDIASGRKSGVRRIDWGVQASHRRVLTAFKRLLEYKLIEIDATYNVGKDDVMLVKPNWFDAVDWQTFVQGVALAPLEREGNDKEFDEKMRADVAKILPGLKAMAPELSFSAFREEVKVDLDGVEPLVSEERDVFLDVQAEIKARRGQSPLAIAAGHNHIPIEEAVAIVNAVLDATGLRAIADGEGPTADKVHAEAVQTATTLMGLGVRNAQDVKGITENFRASSIYQERKNQVIKDLNARGVTPTPEQIIAGVPIYNRDLINQASRLLSARQALEAASEPTIKPPPAADLSDDFLVVPLV